MVHTQEGHRADEIQGFPTCMASHAGDVREPNSITNHQPSKPNNMLETLLIECQKQLEELRETTNRLKHKNEVMVAQISIVVQMHSAAKDVDCRLTKKPYQVLNGAPYLGQVATGGINNYSSYWVRPNLSEATCPKPKKNRMYHHPRSPACLASRL